MSYVWTDDHRRNVRVHAVSDVFDGMSVAGAAALWAVQVDEFERLVDEARGAAEVESS